MSKYNRTNPNPANRALIERLCQSNVLLKSPLGLRHIIRAKTGKIEDIGFDIGYRPFLENFHPNIPTHSSWVDYLGRRALITVTIGCNRKEWENTPCDLSGHFSPNKTASQLLSQQTTLFQCGVRNDEEVYGDAVLVSDTRQHLWIKDPILAHNVTNFMLTPHTLYTGEYFDKHIMFFHEEPNEVDLTYLILKTA